MFDPALEPSLKIRLQSLLTELLSEMPRSRGRSAAVVVARVPVVVGGKKKRKARGRARVSRAMAGPMTGCDCTLEYFKSLSDPFELGGLKLGWGCMVPTTSVQATFRGTSVTGTDGSLGIVLLPSPTTGLLLYNTVATAPNPTILGSLSNFAAITANCAEGRIVSMGVRAFPNVALTTVPGVVYSGATVASNFITFNALSPNDLIALPTSHQSIGLNGASSTGRPIDPESFIFSSFVISGFTAGAANSVSIPFSVPYIVFTGLTPGATVFIEAVINIEATQVIAHGATTVLPDTDELSETVGDHWPTPESLHRLLGKYLPHPGRAGEAAASKDVGYLQAMWSGLKGIGGSAAKSIGAQTLRSVGGPLMQTAAMQLMGGITSGQRYGRQFAGYLQ